MSNEAFGYVCPAPSKANYRKLKNYIHRVGVGFSRIKEHERYNVPESFMEEKDKFSFVIGDRPGYPNTTYLMDCYYYYDPISSNIGFPVDPHRRLEFFLDIISNIFMLLDCKKLVIVLTDSGQIENIKSIKISEARKIIGEDFMRYQDPPDTLYEIKKD